MDSASTSGFDFRERPCPTCGTDVARVLGLRGGEHHRYRMGVASRIVQCERCGLVFPNPFPYARRATDLYGDPEKYFAHLTGDIEERHVRLVREALSLTRGPGKSLLDVGCGLGQLIRAARQEGIEEVVGLEITEETARNARERSGLDVRCMTVEEFARTADRKFDIVTLAAVLEHAYDPDSMIAAISKLTRPGGILYIDVPCEPNLLTHVGNAVNRLMRKPAVLNLSPTWPPFHVFGFNERALRALLAKHGFALESLEIWAAPQIPSSTNLKDRLRSLVATQINRLANVLHMSANMSGWARRLETSA